MDYQQLLSDLADLAIAAGRALPLTPPAMDAHSKAGKANYVTEYDRLTQQRLFEGCLALAPDAVMIGEESYETGGALPDAAAIPRSFVIDPIDGTTNFIRGYRHSAISIGYLEYGAVMAAVIYNPWQDECFTALRGAGAWVNGVPMHVAESDMAHCLLTYGTSPYYAEMAHATFAALDTLTPLIGDSRRTGSAALDLAYLAAGRTDAFFEMRLSPWDYAAGSLLITEAGGVITSIDGSPLRWDAPCSVLAAIPGLYRPLRDVLDTVL